MKRSVTDTAQYINESRRRILGGALGIGVVAGLGGFATRKPAVVAIDGSPTKAIKRGYHETEHIRRYYRSAGL